MVKKIYRNTLSFSTRLLTKFIKKSNLIKPVKDLAFLNKGTVDRYIRDVKVSLKDKWSLRDSIKHVLISIYLFALLINLFLADDKRQKDEYRVLVSAMHDFWFRNEKVNT